MSFGSTFDVGTLTATFNLSAAPATAAIAGIQSQMTALRQSFTQNNTLTINTTAATAALNTTKTAATGLKTVLESIGALAVFGVLVKGVKDIGDAMIGTNSKIQQATTSLEALTGNAATATDMVGKLETLASHSVFGLPQLTQSAQQLVAFGVAAQNVPPLLQAIQTAAAASGGDVTEKLGRINYVIAELNSGIPLSARQLRQLATAGVPLGPLAAQLGITVEQLMTAGKTGIVTSDQLVTAFQKVYTSGNLGDFMQKQAGTFGGAMNLIKTNLSLAVAQGFKPLFDVLSDLVVKIALFVQTPTFSQWVSQVQQGVSAVIGVLKELGSILGPIGKAFADLFGFNTGNIAAEMDAVKNAKVDVGNYDAAIKGAGASTADTKAKTAEYKQTIDDAKQALVGITRELDANKVALDNNALAIQNVKNQYDPLIKGAEAKIKDMSLLSPEQLSRKDRELQLDKDRAALDLTKRDTSAFDSIISADRIKLDNMPKLDTGIWDDQIKGYDKQLKNFDASSYTSGIRKQIDTLQDSDPGAGFTKQIQSIQDAMSKLDPEEATRKITQTIQGIRDHIASLDPQAATQHITETIQGIKDAMSSLDPEAATRGITDTIQGIRDHIASLDPEAATRGITDTIQGIRDAMSALDPQAATQEITDTIQGIRDAMSALNPHAATQEITDTIQGIKDAMSALDPQAATQEITDTIQGIRDAMSALDPQAATKGITDTIQSIQDAMRALDPEEATRGLTSQIDAIKSAMSALDPQAATNGITSQIQAIQDEIHGLNTSELDEKIQHVRDAISQPAPDTSGLKNQLAALSAEIQGAGAGADTSALQAKYASVSAQKVGIEQKYTGDQTGLKGQLSLLERQRSDTRLAQAETKRADEARIVDLNRQAKAITEGIADQRKAIQEQVVGLESQKKAISEGIADQRKAMQERIVGLEREKQSVTENIADQRKAMQERIVGLEREKQLVTEEIADQRKAMQERIVGLEREKQLVTEEIADQKKAMQEQIVGLEREKKSVEEGITDQRKAMEQRIVGLEREKKAVTEGIADQKKADEARIVDLTRQAKAITEGIADQRKAMQERIVGLEREKKGVEERIASEKRADEARIVGLTRQATAIKEGIADQRKGDEEQIRGLERQKMAAAAAKKEQLDSLNDQLKIQEALARSDKKKIEDDKQAVVDAKQAAVDARQDAVDKINAEIKAQEALKLAAMGPYDIALKKIEAEQAHLALLDKAAAAQRALDIAPIKQQLDEWKDKESALLEPLNLQKQRLDDIKMKLDEQKAAQMLVRQEAEANATALKDSATNAGVLSNTLANNVAPAMQKIVDSYDVKGDSPIVTWLKGIQTWMEAHKTDIADAFKAQWDLTKANIQEGVDAVTKIWQLGQDLWNGDWTKFFTDLGGSQKIAGDLQRHDWNQLLVDLGLATTTYHTGALNEVDQYGNTVTTKQTTLYKAWWNDRDAFYKGLGLSDSKYYGNFKLAIGDFIHAVTSDTEKGHETWYNDQDTFYKDLGLSDNKYYGNFKLAIGDFFSAVGTLTHTWWTNQTTTFGNAFSDFGQGFNEAIGPDGFLTQFFKDWPNHITDALKGLDNLIGAPFQSAWTTLGNFFAEVSKAMEWLANTFHISGFTGYTPGGGDAGKVSSSGSAGVGTYGTPGAGVPGNAQGTKDWRGGISWVGEEGPELMYVPQHSVIVPHKESKQIAGFADGLNWPVGEDGRSLLSRKGDRNTGPLKDIIPGFADGLNFDGIGAFVQSAGGLFKAGVGAVVDKTMGMLPNPGLDGIMAGAGKALVSEVKDGLLGWLKGSPDNHAPISRGAAGGRAGGISGAGDLIAAIIAATPNKGEQMSMLMGAMLETGGQNVPQTGGGPGAGYWQIEAGPGGQYAGQVDPYDAAAAARFMEGDYGRAMGYFNPANLEGSLVDVAYHAERPAKYYDQGQIDNAWNLIQPFLVGGGIGAPTGPPVPTGAWSSVVDLAIQHLGETNQANGTTWNGWCEKFMDDMDDAAGFGSYRAGTAFLHGVHSQQTGAIHAGDPNAPAGASVWFDQSWGSAGHAAIATGRGNETVSTPIADGHDDIHYANIIGNSGYMGWAPPGLADGGYFPANDPRLAMIGEGRHDEIVAPLPMLREVVRSEAGGSTVHINFESGAIVTHPGQQSEDVARMIVTEMQERVMMADKRARGFAG